RPFASILLTVFDRNRSIKRYSRLRRRTPLHLVARAAAARSLPRISLVRTGKNRQTRSRRGCPIGVRFTLTRNEGFDVWMGYHGALWASTGIGFTNARAATNESSRDDTSRLYGLLSLTKRLEPPGPTGRALPRAAAGHSVSPHPAGHQQGLKFDV
ncbi:hypothetical protein, partial [Mesorhizobium sp. M7A.F.Ca.US.001.02.1.1]|uniref:hypothetical protein n=1 Tax=Mesorhizobium sp. M7A.F.Ca.US.001.02.1.1 TaxID=2496703 RepID=UPI0019D4516F